MCADVFESFFGLLCIFVVFAACGLGARRLLCLQAAE